MMKRLSGGILFFAVWAVAAASEPLSAEISPSSTPAEKGSGLRFGFSLSGGLLGLDGGDFNSFIRDSKSRVADANAAAGETLYAVDWTEMKSMPDFKGEVFVRFGRYFGVGLGVEYIRRTNPGTVTFSQDDSFTTRYLSYYLVTTKTVEESWAYSQTLSVIPITLNLYGCLPLGRRGEAFVNIGPGLYLGSWKSELDLDKTSVNNLDWYRNDGSAWPPQYRSSVEYQDIRVEKATCTAVGFHFGTGFAYALSDRLSLFAEASYRLVNFKKWTGSGTSDYTEKAEYGWTNEAETTVQESSGSDSWSGDVWAYDEERPELEGGSYRNYGVFEVEPDEAYGINVRRAEINLNGWTLRLGLRICFGGR